MKFRLHPLKYVHDHWRGLHGLAWSFWVNLIALRAALSVAQSSIFSDWAQIHDPIPTPLVLTIMLANIVVFVWQVTGVLRACDAWLHERGSISNTWGAQLGILGAALLMIADSWGYWILAVPVEDTAALSQQLIREQAARYDFSRSDQSPEIHFSGEIVPGATKALVAILGRFPDTKTLILTSDGGNIFEARGLAKLVRDNGLNTRVPNSCSSACTLVFIAGTRRELARDGRLGFHSYRIDGKFGGVFVDVAAQEAHDRSLFAAAGVAPWFLERAYDAPADSIWFPNIEELKRAGVVSE